MYTIDNETLKKIVETHNFLNQVEVKGISNLQLLYNGLFNLQEVIKNLNEQANIQQKKSVKVDNTKKGE